MVIEYFMEWVQSAPLKKREAAAVAMVHACLSRETTIDVREDVEAALTILLDDKSPTVRLAMAEAFGAFSSAPRHIVAALAADVSDVSMIVLSQSPVFHDSELVHYVRTGEETHQLAISCRPWLSPVLVKAVCEHGCKDAGLGLLVNEAAEFTADDLQTLAVRFGTSTDIRMMLLERADLSAATRHLLIGKLGETLGKFLKQKSWLPAERIESTLGEACDRASIIFAAKHEEEEIRSVVRNLIVSNRLTVAFLIRAICMGNISLVASALSELSGVRFSRVESILTRNRESAFKAVYQRAGLPKSAFVVFWTAIETWRRLLSSGSQINQSRLPFIVTREVLDAYCRGEEIMDELLVLLRRLAAETARENSRAKAEEITRRAAESAQARQVEGSLEWNGEIENAEFETLQAANENSEWDAEPPLVVHADIDVGELMSIAQFDVDPHAAIAALGNEDLLGESFGSVHEALLHVPAVRAA